MTERMEIKDLNRVEMGKRTVSYTHLTLPTIA